MLKKMVLPFWFLGAIFIFLYSFTQVDLSLTLSKASIFQETQRVFQQIGWFDRPLSTYLYISLLGYLFVLFIWTLKFISENKTLRKNLWIIIIVITLIVAPSYNAFSYDLFNYIFDARILTHYGLNPYEYKPMDFTNDPMLSFMRSVHRVYPYGPTWLGLTAPLTLISNEIFILSFFLFKSLSAAAFLGTAYFTEKIAGLLKARRNTNLALAAFALNPLVLLEGLVSSHNEMVMMFFAVLSLYLLLVNRKFVSLLALIFSIGIKFATLVFIPIILLKIFFKNIGNEKIIFYTLILSIIAVIITSAASGQNKNPEFQPWYLLLIAPFAVLSNGKFVMTLFITVCIASLISYTPYLYMGNWPEDIVSVKNIMVGTGIFVGIISYFLIKYGTKLIR